MEGLVVQRKTSLRPNVFFGHHKAATSWVVSILSDVAHLNGLSHKIIDTAAEFDDRLREQLESGEVDFLSFRNADPDYTHLLPSFRGVHIIRDPRYIVVSSYFSHKNSHPTANWPELALHRARLESLPPDEGLLADMEFCKTLPTNGFDVRPLASMAAWDCGQADILELRYEDVVVRPYESLVQIFSHFGTLGDQEFGFFEAARHLGRVLVARSLGRRWIASRSIPSWNLLAAVYENRFDKQAEGRALGVEDRQSHYRKGVAGDWRNHFRPAHKQFFKDTFGDIVVRLGYEETDDW
jgi:hypothetical protein